MNVFLKTLRGELTETVPFWFMRQAGRYLPEYRQLRETAEGFLDLCYSPGKAEEVTLQPIRRFGMDAAILFSDILVVPHAMGCDVRFVKGEGPQMTPVRDDAALDALTDAIDAIASPVYETVARLSESLPQDTALIGFAGAPWTVACYMVEGHGVRDFPLTRELSYAKPDYFTRLIDRLTTATIQYLSRQIDAGAQAVQLFDSWAGLLPEAQFERWCIAPHQKIVAALKATYPEIPLIGFAKGAGPQLMHYSTAVPVNAMGVDMQTPIGWARDMLGGAKVLQGNLDPLLLAADKDAAVAETQRILECWRDIPFIFNLGHGIVPHTPIAHVEAVVETIKTFRR